MVIIIAGKMSITVLFITVIIINYYCFHYNGGGLVGLLQHPFARGQGVRHRLTEGARKFGVEVAKMQVGVFAQDNLGGNHAESAGRLRSMMRVIKYRRFK